MGKMKDFWRDMNGNYNVIVFLDRGMGRYRESQKREGRATLASLILKLRRSNKELENFYTLNCGHKINNDHIYLT
jgi:hypothetical protein